MRGVAPDGSVLADAALRVEQLCRLEQLLALVALIAVCTVCFAVRTRSLDVAVR